MRSKLQSCLWFDGNAEEAANFCAATFPHSQVTSVNRALAIIRRDRKGKS